MKIGEYKVKRNYKLAQIMLDASSLVVLVLMGLMIASLYVRAGEFNVPIPLAAFVFPVTALVFVALTLFYTYKNHKLPKKYKIDEENAQKYYDIIILALSAVRLIALLAVYELQFIYNSSRFGEARSFLSFRVLCDIVLIIIIIRFSMLRLRATQKKKVDKKYTYREN